MEAQAVIPRKITVLIADDHRLFADALEAILSTDGRFEIVGKAHDGESAVQMTGTTKPDVVLMDIAMPGVDGVEATRRIRKRHKSTAVLILTGSIARAGPAPPRTSRRTGSPPSSSRRSPSSPVDSSARCYPGSPCSPFSQSCTS
jgi:CheY-like chemotaxis protein